MMSRDLNSADPGRDQAETLDTIPLATDASSRKGNREQSQRPVAEGFPLTVKTRSLVTGVIFDEKLGDDGLPRAVGVNYLEGSALYRADPRSKQAGQGTARSVRVSREVILAAGAFNT